MARIRSIKPEFCASEQITECSPNARLTFVLMWIFCDDYGVHPASPKRLKMEIYPADDISSTEIRNHIDELINNGLLIEYQVGTEVFWHVTGWEKHQKIDQRTGKYPLPNGEIGGKIRRISTEQSPSIHPSFTHGVERSGEEKNRIDKKENIKEKKSVALPSKPTLPSVADKKQKHQYGENKNVLLTDEELLKLQTTFPSDWKEKIDNLSYYIGSKGGKYASHYLTILNWARKDKKDNPQHPVSPQKTVTSTEVLQATHDYLNDPTLTPEELVRRRAGF